MIRRCKLSEDSKVSARRRRKEASNYSSCSSYANTGQCMTDVPNSGNPRRRDGDAEEMSDQSDATNQFRRNQNRIRYDPTQNPSGRQEQVVSLSFSLANRRRLPGRETLLRRSGGGD